jgi:hypothetical protein
MPNQPPQDLQSNLGLIEIRNYTIKSNIMARKDQNGKPIPDVFHELILIGNNMSGQGFTTIYIRFRDPKDIVTNPTGSENMMIMEVPKTDFEYFDWLVKKTIDSSAPKPKALIMQYSPIANRNEYHVSFSIQ